MGCQDYRQFVGQLHVSYPGSQLQYAKNYIKANPQTRYVSLTIGGNDLYRLQEKCAVAADVNGCFLGGLPVVLNTVRANLNTAYTGLRSAGFKGDFVASTYYSTNYADLLTTGVLQSLNLVLASVTWSHGGKVSDGFGAFAKATLPFKGDTCKSGLMIHLTPTTCDIHPSPAGAALLASAFQKAEALTSRH